MRRRAVLVVEDDADLREALQATLELAGYQVHAAADGHTALEVAQREPLGLVVSDLQMSPVDGLELLHGLKVLRPVLPVVLMTAYGDVAKAVAAMHAGATDFVCKPFEPSALLGCVERYCVEDAPQLEGGFVARDPKSVALLDVAARVARATTTVLLTGESGCGKEMLARFLHRRSPRAAAPFVAINCAAIPENLLEATLFGHEKGAFTGAAQAHPGKFEQADGGTLLLDEVSEMPPALQAKLLRVLQEREVERIGASRPRPVDVRVVATSNRDLRAAVADGAFRADLYYRLSVFPLHLPPLRERPADIAPLAAHLLTRHAAAAGGAAAPLAPEVLARLAAHTWPGNVRELDNALQRALILAAGEPIGLTHFDLLESAASAAPAAPAAQDPAPAAGAGGRLDMKSLERAHILETLLAVNGSRKLAVQRLGISERTLRHKLRQYRMTASG